MSDVCPKRMEFGPCADVSADGDCEVPGIRCPFISHPAPRWVATPPSLPPTLPPLLRPLVMSELPEPGNDGAAIRAIARRLADGATVDAVLFGDTNYSRVRFPPSYRAILVESEGLRAWPGLNARDRNRVALEGELAALAEIGVAGVHCVTGNHTQSGHRPDAQPVFDLDSTRLASLAAGMGHTVSIAASPHTTPVDQRPVRTADKAFAGASWAFIDQPVDPDEVDRFIQAVRLAGATGLRFAAVVTVPLFADDLVRLLAYTNARVPAGWGEAMSRAFPTPGPDLALAFCRRLLRLDGLDGVLLGATCGPEHAEAAADAFIHVAGQLRS